MDTKENKNVLDPNKKYLDMSATCELNLTEILNKAFHSLFQNFIVQNQEKSE